MDEASRFAIPFARDRYGNDVDIDETVDGGDYYCPKCGEPLEARVGPQLQYFAHKRNNERSFDCEAYSGTWGPALRAERTTPPSELAARHRRIRLAVTRDPYRPRLNLIGLVPAALPDEWDVWSRDSWTTSSTGLMIQPFPLMFQPGKVQAELKLDSRSTTFLFNVERGPPSLIGPWSASMGEPGPRFVGDRDRAEARDSLGNLWEGQIVFLPDAPGLGFSGSTQVSLGDRQYREIEVNEVTIPLIRAAFGAAGMDSGGFEVRVILPVGAPPYGLDHIVAAAKERILLHAVPSSKVRADPPIDVLELPAVLHEPTRLTPTGLGVPRPYEFTLGDAECRRFDFSWNVRHIAVQANRRNDDSASTRIGPQLEVGVAYFDRDWRIFPSTVDESILHPVTRRPSVNTAGDRWKMVGPEAITAAVVYDTFDEMGRRHPYDRRLKANQLARGIETALYEGAENVRIDFGVLGAVRLTSPLFTRATLSSVNLVERVLAIGPPKGHLRWSYIRKVLNSPSLDQRTVPGGTKKRVRRAILLARRQKKGGG